MKNYCFVIFTVAQIHHGSSKPAGKGKVTTGELEGGSDGTGPPAEASELPDSMDLSGTHGYSSGNMWTRTGVLQPESNCCFRKQSTAINRVAMGSEVPGCRARLPH